MNLKPTKISAVILSALILTSCIFACEKQSEDIVEHFDTPVEVSDITGVEPIEFVPEGYKIAAHRAVYDIVSEVEYTPVEGTDKKYPKIAVFRAVDAIFSTTNLSGFADTALTEVYYPALRGDLSLSIEARDEFLAVEWSDTFGGKECNFSLSLTNGSVEEFKNIIDGALEYISANAE
ncbi:MAG: hypothetical protein E7656_05115 [Ruminococcaceae bacterium]|nr:hypothetical protein [Oscillospiraceae bacterium]